MSEEKIIEALRAARALVEGHKKKWEPRRLSEEEMTQKVRDLDPPKVDQHLLFMCDEAERMLKEGRREKVMRWLGFLQGALWAFGLSTISDSKNANRPDEAPQGIAPLTTPVADGVTADGQQRITVVGTTKDEEALGRLIYGAMVDDANFVTPTPPAPGLSRSIVDDIALSRRVQQLRDRAVCEGCGRLLGDCSCGESTGRTPHHPSGRPYDDEEWEQFNK